MATLKQRLHRKNAAGTFDTVHLESSSDLILRPSGRTVEQDLADYLPRVQNNDNVPQTLGWVRGSTKAYIGQKSISFDGHTHDDRYFTETEVNNLLSGKAASSHSHSASQITSGTLSVARGGTGVTSISALKSALGVTGTSVTSYSIIVAGSRNRLRTYTLPQYAQYCVVNDNLTNLGLINISRSTYAVQPDYSVIQSSGFRIYYDTWNASGESAYFSVHALLSSDGRTLWTYSYCNINYSGTDSSCALLIYY